MKGDARAGLGGRQACVQGTAKVSRMSPFGPSVPGRANQSAGRPGDARDQRAKNHGGQPGGRAVGAAAEAATAAPAVPPLALGPTPRPPWPSSQGGGEEAAGPGPTAVAEGRLALPGMARRAHAEACSSFAQKATKEPDVACSFMQRAMKDRDIATPCVYGDHVVSGDHPVVAFLRSAGLGQYAEVLLQSGFDDMETLLDIEDVDMKDLDIPRGHAVKLRRKLREYRCPQASPVPTSFRGASATSRFSPPTTKMTNAVEQSWEKVQEVGMEAVSELFYRNLFELAPEMTEYFPPEVRMRHRDWSLDDSADESDIYDSPGLRKIFTKILLAVGAAVAGLHDINRLVPMLAQLGERHSGLGIEEAHYHILGKALICTLRSTLSDMFVPEVEFAWTMVYSFISAIMVGGSINSKRADAPRPMLPAVGRDVTGGREVYRIERHLQKAIFGDVYEATGMTSGRSFAVKVLDRDTVHRFGSMQQQDHQFCESPLCEVRFVEMMRGLEHVAQLEDHFGDQYYHFVVSELATGGDLLEALRLRPGGFPEQRAQMLILEAAKGLASLHQRGLAMQDVSIENMLLYVLEDEQWHVRVCDPGQAVPFTVDPVTSEEQPVQFNGFVAKEFRPPELYMKQEYVATKVDAWCLGWSTFYLLAAQPMFHSADPSIDDPDYTLFLDRPQRLFQQKGWRSTLSHQAKDFILALMHVDPHTRMSVRHALRHPWLTEWPLSATAAHAAAVQGKAAEQLTECGLGGSTEEPELGDSGGAAPPSPKAAGCSGDPPTLLGKPRPTQGKPGAAHKPLMQPQLHHAARC